MSSTPRILVAEDSVINQKLIAHLLTKLNLPFTIVENGQEVLTKLEEEPYDFVFMDLNMPVMNGFEATAEINRLYSPTQRPVIIALTGNSEEGDREECMAAGMKGFITKPIMADAVREIIDKWFR